MKTQFTKEMDRELFILYLKKEIQYFKSQETKQVVKRITSAPLAPWVFEMEYLGLKQKLRRGAKVSDDHARDGLRLDQIEEYFI